MLNYLTVTASVYVFPYVYVCIHVCAEKAQRLKCPPVLLLFVSFEFHQIEMYFIPIQTPHTHTHMYTNTHFLLVFRASTFIFHRLMTLHELLQRVLLQHERAAP